MQEKVQENLKILYSIEEILQKGYKIKTSIPKERRCPYCNKILKPKGILNPLDRSIHIFLQNENCNCSKAMEEQKQLQLEKGRQLMEELERLRKEEINKKIKQYYGTEFITEQFKRQTLDNFITNETNKNMKYVAQRFIQGFGNTKKGIIFVGKNGTGKTHISVAIANELIKQNIPILFGTLTDLTEKYSGSYKDHTEIELTKLYAKVDLLIIDDLGVEYMNDWMLSKLFVIVNERMKNELPIIITTNYELEQLKQRLSIPNKVCETTNSIISRLYEMCYRVEFKGNDYRMN
jgi:DNA replication protein DnaC